MFTFVNKSTLLPSALNTVSWFCYCKRDKFPQLFKAKSAAENTKVHITSALKEYSSSFTF